MKKHRKNAGTLELERDFESSQLRSATMPLPVSKHKNFVSTIENEFHLRNIPLL
jgi:hypothetical protein